MGIGDWGLGIGDWGLGIGPNPQSPFKMNNTYNLKTIIFFLVFYLIIIIFLIYKDLEQMTNSIKLITLMHLDFDFLILKYKFGYHKSKI
jgi:hypothetical protein